MIPFIYISVGDFSEGLAFVLKDEDGKWGFIDNRGNIVIPNIYDDEMSFSEGLASVKKDGKYGYINNQGEEVISFIYDFAHSFSYDGEAKVTLNGKDFKINKKGECVEDCP
jgi:hypothetical protein